MSCKYNSFAVYIIVYMHIYHPSLARDGQPWADTEWLVAKQNTPTHTAS